MADILSMIASGGNFAPVSSYYQGLAKNQAGQIAQQKAQSEALYKQAQEKNLLSQALQRKVELQARQAAASGMQNPLMQAATMAGNWTPYNQAVAPTEFGRYQGMDPATRSQYGEFKALGRQPLVSVSTGTQEPTFQQKMIEGDIRQRWESSRDYNKSLISSADTAQTQVPALKRSLQLLDTVYTGPLADQKLAAQRMGRLLGFEVPLNELASGEELQKYMGDQVMARVAQTKGAVSEKEMALFTQYSANFGKTQEGNRRIMEFQLANATRANELSKIVRDGRKQGLTAPEVEEKVRMFQQENPLDDVLLNVKTDEFARMLGIPREEAVENVMTISRERNIPPDRVVEMLRANE